MDGWLKGIGGWAYKWPVDRQMGHRIDEVEWIKSRFPWLLVSILKML